MVSEQVKKAIPKGLYCIPELCPYCKEENICEVMGEKIKSEYKICGINEFDENLPLTKE